MYPFLAFTRNHPPIRLTINLNILMVPCLQSVHQHVAGSHQVNRDQTESSQVKDTVRNASAVGLLQHVWARARMCARAVSESSPTQQRPSISLSLAGCPVEGEEWGSWVLSLALAATQASNVLYRWTMTTWPSSFGWHSGSACATLETSLACLARPGNFKDPAGVTKTG